MTLPAIIDSGADATMMPVRYLQRIHAVATEKKQLRGVQGLAHQVRLYNIFVQIGEYGLYARVVGDELNDEVIIGRDVLNQWMVTLNGLASVVEISQ